MSHLPGLPLIARVAIGIGAMSVTMLRLPLTSVLLATLLLGSGGLAVTPLVIVAVVIAYVVTARINPLRQPDHRGRRQRRARNVGDADTAKYGPTSRLPGPREAASMIKRPGDHGPRISSAWDSGPSYIRSRRLGPPGRVDPAD